MLKIVNNLEEFASIYFSHFHQIMYIANIKLNKVFKNRQNSTLIWKYRSAKQIEVNYK
jgi:hypothetical protein